MAEGQNYNLKNREELERMMISPKDRYSSIYRRKQLLLNMLQATTTQSSKIFQGHTEKILYVHPQQQDNFPRVNKSRRESTSRNNSPNHCNEALNTYYPQKKKSTPKPIRFFKSTYRNSNSSEKKNQQFKIESRSIKIPITTIKLPFVENSDKKFNRIATEMYFAKEVDCSTSSANQFKRYYDQVPSTKKVIVNINKKKSVTFNPQRPQTKNTKLFNFVVKQDFTQKEQHLQDDQLSEIDYFQDYVNKHKF